MSAIKFLEDTLGKVENMSKLESEQLRISMLSYLETIDLSKYESPPEIINISASYEKQVMLINKKEAETIHELLNCYGQTGYEFGELWDRINIFLEEIS